MESLVENGFYEGRKVKLQRAVALQAAETALVLGRPDSALSLARQAHTIARRDSLAESRSTYVGESLLIEGRALLTLGDTTGALDSLERALAALSIGAGPSHRRTLEARSVLHRLPGRSAPMVKSGTG